MFGSSNSRTDETIAESPVELGSRQPSSQTGVASGDDADTDGERARTKKHRVNFGNNEKTGGSKRSKRITDREKRHKKKREHEEGKQDDLRGKALVTETEASIQDSTPIKMSQATGDGIFQSSPKKPFNIRNISFRPAIEKTFSTNLLAPINGIPPTIAPENAAAALSGLRRTASLPDRLNREGSVPVAASARPLPHLMPSTSDTKHEDDKSERISRTASVVLLLFSTALVALCAEYLVASIGYLVNHTSVSEAFVGLIILPIIGNAAEHFVAVKVASQNKMDLAIGVAVGSSIQIGLLSRIDPFHFLD
jgi:Ca2+:H+ antiporter